MNTPSVFDSRDPRYKQPYGALLCGKEWSLTCRPLSSEGFTHCSVVIRREFAGHEMEAEMPFTGFQEDRAVFSLSLIPFQTLLAGRRHRLSSGQDRLPQHGGPHSLAAHRL